MRVQLFCTVTKLIMISVGFQQRCPGVSTEELGNCIKCESSVKQKSIPTWLVSRTAFKLVLVSRTFMIAWHTKNYSQGVAIKHRNFNPFAPGDFAEKRVLKLVEWFSGHCRAIKR